jgi:hypothetical protein
MPSRAVWLSLLVLGAGASFALPAALQDTKIDRPEKLEPPPEALKEFQERFDAYLAVHRKAEASLAPLPNAATPEQISQTQRQLSKLIRDARPGVTPGNVFTPAMEQHIRRVVEAALSGPTGEKRRVSIMDENPQAVVLAVYDRYPSTVPLSTMPTDVLAALPPLAESLEFRFVGDDLILLDTHADLIVDIIQDVLPAKAVDV